MKIQNRVFVSAKCLSPVLLTVAILAGCSSGGGDPDPQVAANPSTSLQGAAFVPGGASLKGSLFKALPGNGPFVGAGVKATSLRDGIAYPKEGVALVGLDGGFSIADVPRGQDYLVIAKKGNMVVIKLITVPDNAPATMNVGEVDAASTSVALMFERFIKEALNLGEDFDLSRGTNGVDPEKLKEAVTSADLAALETKVVALATKVEELGDDVEALRDELEAGTGAEDRIAIVNVYNTVVQILTIADVNLSDDTDDVLHDWRDDGEIGGATVACTRVAVDIDDDGSPVIIVETNVVVTPVDLFEFLRKITRPQTTITAAPPKSSPATSASVSFVSTRAGSTFECQLDGNGFTGCTSPKLYDGLSFGEHAFCVVATDSTGVNDPSPACYTWTIFDNRDVTPPETTIVGSPQDPSGSPTATFAFVSNEPGSTFECELDGDGSAFISCSSPKTYAGLGNDSHTFKVRATDPAGNTDESPATRTWTVVVDNDRPETTITNGPPDPTDSASAAFTFVSDESGSTFQCQLDDLALVGCTSPTTYNSVTNGPHVFSVFATDPAGNPDESPAEYPWEKVQDSTPPETTIDSGPSNPSSSTSATFTFSSNESGSTFQCDLDGGGFVGCTSPKTYTNLAEGEHTFSVVATDQAGNTDVTPSAHTWAIATVPPCAIFCEAFESGLGDWAPSNGIWEVGLATTGPNECHNQSSGCAATILAGDYPNTNSNFVSPSITLPAITATEELHLRFWHWFSFALNPGCFGCDNDYGRIYIQEQISPGVWSAAAQLSSYVGTSGNVWTRPLVDLSAYAGKKVRLLFGLVNGSGAGVSSGWYVDDVTIDVVPANNIVPFAEDFQGGLGNWWANNGTWEVGGPPTAGPAECHNASTTCAATVLNGDYQNINSSLVSPSITLPAITTGEELHLRFWHWFSFALNPGCFGCDNDYGRIYVQEQTSPGVWGTATELSSYVGTSGGVWTRPLVDLSAYAGKKVRLLFGLVNGSGAGVSSGWYVDDVTIDVVPANNIVPFAEDFQGGLGNWWANNGTWEVGGPPTAGPAECHNASTTCAATVLNGDYQNINSSLVSPSITLPAITVTEELHLRFWHWFSFALNPGCFGCDNDYGRIYVQEQTSPGVWGTATELSSYVGTSGGVWTRPLVDLSAYAGKKVRLLFGLVNGRGAGVSSGWYVDDAVVEKNNP